MDPGGSWDPPKVLSIPGKGSLTHVEKTLLQEEGQGTGLLLDVTVFVRSA